MMLDCSLVATVRVYTPALYCHTVTCKIHITASSALLSRQTDSLTFSSFLLCPRSRPWQANHVHLYRLHCTNGRFLIDELLLARKSSYTITASSSIGLATRPHSSHGTDRDVRYRRSLLSPPRTGDFTSSCT